MFLQGKNNVFNLCMNKKYEKTGPATDSSSKIGFPQSNYCTFIPFDWLGESQRNKREGVQPATLLTIKLPHNLFSTIFNKVVEYLF